MIHTRVQVFANTPHTIGSEGIEFWMFSMQEWMTSNGANASEINDVFGQNNTRAQFYHTTRRFLDDIDRYVRM